MLDALSTINRCNDECPFVFQIHLRSIIIVSFRYG